jgi:hypothetical protein
MMIGVAQSGYAQDRPAARRGEAAGYSSRDATTLSMMGWGVILAVTAAAVSVIFKDPSSNSSSGGGGGGGHSH